MAQYTVSPRAEKDIDDIWNYTFAHWGLDQAEIYIRNIQLAIDTVATDPHKGRRCDDIRKGYSQYLVGPHIIFYRLSTSTVDVVRILHQYMDFTRHL